MTQEPLAYARDRAIRDIDPRAPLLEAARRGSYKLWRIAHSDQSWPPDPCTWYDLAGEKAIVLICDDTERDEALLGAIGRRRVASLGPSAWRSAKEARDWGCVFCLHDSGGSILPYRAAAHLVSAYKRLLFVETSPARTVEWVELLSGSGRPILLSPQAVGMQLGSSEAPQ